MNTICKSAMIAGLAFSAFAFAAMAGSSVRAGPIVPPGRYCMTWDIGGSDCSLRVMPSAKRLRQASMRSVTVRLFAMTKIRKAKAVVAIIREPRPANAQPVRTGRSGQPTSYARQ
jgi:hypothetical protein